MTLAMLNELTMTLAMMGPPGENGEAPNPLGMILPLVLTIGVMYFLLFRPQQKKMAEHRKFLESLKKGDHVITNGGIYGRVWAMQEKVVTLEIAKGVRIEVTRESIQGRGRADEASSEESEESEAKKKS